MPVMEALLFNGLWVKYKVLTTVLVMAQQCGLVQLVLHSIIKRKCLKKQKNRQKFLTTTRKVSKGHKQLRWRYSWPVNKLIKATSDKKLRKPLTTIWIEPWKIFAL